MSNKLNDNHSENFDKDFDETKRKSLIKMGKRAVYVAPVVLTLLTSANASPMSAAPKTTGWNKRDGRRGWWKKNRRNENRGKWKHRENSKRWFKVKWW